MRRTKRFLALTLVLVMTLSVVPLYCISASAIAGAGAPSATDPEFVFGIDLSYWNVGGTNLDYDRVDFNKLKASGCEFIILRIGYETSTTSSITVDLAFHEYYKRARAAGIPLGLYFYSYALSYDAAAADARWVMDYIEQYDMYFEYPIYLDMETEAQTGSSTTKATKNAICLGWCETLEARGYYPGIYSAYWVYDVLTADFKSRYDFWVPAYKSSDDFDPQYTYNSVVNKLGGNPYSNGYCMWQYSSSNVYNGSYVYQGVYTSNAQTATNSWLDLNICYKDYPTIMKTYGYNNCVSKEKLLLEEAIAKAKEERYTKYSENSIQTLRSAYENAISVYNSTSSSDDNYKSARLALESAISSENVISVGKKYTTTIPNRGDIFDDDGIRLTNGVKQTSDPGTSAYSGWTGNTEIIIDLGTAQVSNSYVAYLAGGPWGISVPADGEFIMEVYASSDGTDYASVGTSSRVENAGSYGEEWVLNTVRVVSPSNITARYIKFKISCTAPNRYIWLDEVEVIKGTETALSGGIYVSGINKRVDAGECIVFTSSFGEINVDKANHAWTANAVAEWDNEKNAYVVTSVFPGVGAGTQSVTLSDNQILIAAHCWENEAGIEDPVAGSAANYSMVYSLKQGDVINLDGIDVANGTATAAPYVAIVAPIHEHIPGTAADCKNPQVCTGCGEILAEALGHDHGKVVGNELICTRCGEVIEIIPEPENPDKDETPDKGENPDKDETPDNDETPDPEYSGLRGDINDNEKIDMTDYILLKRFYFGTYSFDTKQLLRADIDANSAINMTDYILLKRVYFKTYTILNPLVKY